MVFETFRETTFLGFLIKKIGLGRFFGPLDFRWRRETLPSYPRKASQDKKHEGITFVNLHTKKDEQRG